MSAESNPYTLYPPQILAATEEGPVAEWLDRIAAIARLAGLNLAHIEWSGKPVTVAHAVVRQANIPANGPGLKALEQAIATYRSSKTT